MDLAQKEVTVSSVSRFWELLGNPETVTSSSGVRVTRDWRRMILVDPAAPELTRKAARDLYGRGTVNGLSRVGSENSEDAVTWNVLRTLLNAQRLDLVDPAFLPGPAEWCFWNFGSPELQENLWHALHDVEGWHIAQKLQPTEMDAVFWQEETLVGIEAKLIHWSRHVESPWEGKDGGWKYERFYYKYASAFRLFRDPFATPLWTECYQLTRHAVILLRLAKWLKIGTPTLLVIWNASGPSASTLATDYRWFSDQLSPDRLKVHCTTWQSIGQGVATAGLERLSQYLFAHPCLQSAAQKHA